MSKIHAGLFLYKDDETRVELHVIKGTFYLDIGGFTIYNPELMKDRLIAELQKIDGEKEEAE